MTQFSMDFSPQSLKEISQFYGFNIMTSPEFQSALHAGAEQIVAAAQANAQSVFANPNGNLADSISAQPESMYEIQITVGVAYGRRREYGFSGMTDSLGRHFLHDPAKPYLKPALDSSQQEVLSALDAGAEAALNRLGG